MPWLPEAAAPRKKMKPANLQGTKMLAAMRATLRREAAVVDSNYFPPARTLPPVVLPVLQPVHRVDPLQDARSNSAADIPSGKQSGRNTTPSPWCSHGRSILQKP